MGFFLTESHQTTQPTPSKPPVETVGSVTGPVVCFSPHPTSTGKRHPHPPGGYYVFLGNIYREKGHELHKKRSAVPMEVLVRKIDELAKRKSWINAEVSSIVSAFGVGREDVGQGCLRLEDVYCVKQGRKYGPYGPYYYLYVHLSGKLQKTYVGKRADQLKVRKDAVELLRDLEREYKRILELERKLMKAVGLI
jgi:hypothetical protein